MSTPPSHELLYFDLPGRAEAIRVMLHAAGIPFEDKRFGFKDWPELKPSTPLGSVPTLKIGATTYCQSFALARYAAKKAGYYPEDAMEALKVDEMMDTINDISSSAPRDSDPEKMKALRQEWQSTKLTQFADFIEARIKANGNGKGTISRPSLADLAIKSTVNTIQAGFFDYVDKDFFDKYPAIL